MPSRFLPRRRLVVSGLAAAPVLAGCAATALPDAAAPLSAEQAREQLRAAERGFAATMARRDLAAFAAFIADDAVFVNGGQPLRGRDAIVGFWSRHFRDPQPPFAWEPAIVEVAAGSTLGYTEGPVTRNGAAFARFYSTWQRRPDGRWHVVFDNGYAECAR